MRAKRFRRQRGRSNHGEAWGIAMALLDGPRDLQGIKGQLSAIARRFGFWGDFFASELHDGVDMDQWLRERLEKLQVDGWVSGGGACYALTDKGRGEASRALEELRRAREKLAAWASPENASRLTLVVHLVLAALKLPAAILSGSVGLLSDAIDTLLDGASSLMVYWGLRRHRERLVSRLLVVFMLASGAFALYEALARILRREAVQPDGFAFTAVLVSAAVCAGLWFVQRFIGLRRESFALVTQSVDSRNHVIVAGSVVAGLIAAALHFPWLDYLVGLAVAALILKSAVELAIDLLRAREEKVDLSRYRFSLLERFRRSQLCAYMLYLVRDGEADSREQLLGLVERSLDFRGNTMLQAIGLDHSPSGSGASARCYEELIKRGELREGPELEITEAGRRRLSANRYFVRGESRREIRSSLGLAARVGWAVLLCWALFALLYWAGTMHLLLRLPSLPLWESLDRSLPGSRGLALSVGALMHLAAGFSLATYAAVRSALIRSLHRLRRHRRAGPAPRLIIDGYFARVRHPLLGASLLHTAGLCLAFPSGWALVPLALAFPVRLLSAWAEERRELLPLFGESYRSYAAVVRFRLLTPWQAAIVAAVAAALVMGLAL